MAFASRQASRRHAIGASVEEPLTFSPSRYTDPKAVWSSRQDEAFRENHPKYTRTLSLNGQPPALYTLWRTMLREVPEFSDFTVEMLKEAHDKHRASDPTNFPEAGSLPFLDEYEFTGEGSVVGRLYGVAGLADGTKIELPGVSDMKTFQFGFICPPGSQMLYELGSPKEDMNPRTAVNSRFGKLLMGVMSVSDTLSQRLSDAIAQPMDSMGITSKSTSTAAKSSASSITSSKQATAQSGTSSNTTESNEPEDSEKSNNNFMWLVGGTAALQVVSRFLLAHHLTVNMFWT
eukprot:Nitzschia sp. Nitz4//scaffold141_size107518//72288//73157//NITZ4_004286-RA/size107518-processed-gene-0.113-mRNA-1//1//CDS//3329536318//1133//frame0